MGRGREDRERRIEVERERMSAVAIWGAPLTCPYHMPGTIPITCPAHMPGTIPITCQAHVLSHARHMSYHMPGTCPVTCQAPSLSHARHMSCNMKRYFSFSPMSG